MKHMKETLIWAGLLWLRVLMGLGISYHGYGKIFGGEKFGEGVDKLVIFTQSKGFPMPHFFAWMAALSEFLGGILIIIGCGTRIAAFFVLSTMTVAAFVAHANDPFKVKELALSYWTIAGTLILTGAGAFSGDAIIWKKKK